MTIKELVEEGWVVECWKDTERGGPRVERYSCGIWKWAPGAPQYTGFGATMAKAVKAAWDDYQSSSSRSGS